MRPSVRRAASLLAAPALTITTLAATSVSASAVPDPAPVAAGTDWLSGQLSDGLVHNDQFGFDDYGLSIDAALGLLAAGDSADAAAVSDAIAEHVDSYTTGVDFGSSDTYAGATAKALLLAQSTGSDGTDFGGVDLVERLEGLVATDAPVAGRIEDDSTFGDNANVIGQTYAALDLVTAESSTADAVESYLLDQQCAEGYFRLSFSPDKTATDQSCDGGTAAQSAADTDVTALFVITMQPLAVDPDVALALDDATAWLQDQQHPDGSFGGGPSTEASNANSTGLSGWALALRGDTAGAASAAAWVRAHQITNAGACTPYAADDLGAIAYDDTARNALRNHAIDETTQDQFRRSSAQALPVLRWAQPAIGTKKVTAPTGYLRGGSRITVGAAGAAPSEALCATLTGGKQAFRVAGATGRASFSLVLPITTGSRTVKVARPNAVLATTTVKVLGAKTLRLTTKRTVHRGGRQKVVVRGLAAREPVKVTIRRSTRSGKATMNGTFVARIKVTKVGRTKAVVHGAFTSRHGSKAFRVVR